jgi:hypothetical protein
VIAEETLSPFKGLRSFEDSEGDVPFFFGRELERAQIEANLMASRLTVVYGETGVGKAPCSVPGSPTTCAVSHGRTSSGTGSPSSQS